MNVKTRHVLSSSHDVGRVHILTLPDYNYHNEQGRSYVIGTMV